MPRDLHISLLDANSSNSESLKLSTREKINVSVHDMI
jgi:hypothetical protein